MVVLDVKMEEEINVEENVKVEKKGKGGKRGKGKTPIKAKDKTKSQDVDKSDVDIKSEEDIKVETVSPLVEPSEFVDISKVDISKKRKSQSPRQRKKDSSYQYKKKQPLKPKVLKIEDDHSSTIPSEAVSSLRRSSRSRCQPISYFELDACTEISEMSTDNSSTCGSVTGSDMNEVIVEKVVSGKKGRRSKSVKTEVIEVEKPDVP